MANETNFRGRLNSVYSAFLAAATAAAGLVIAPLLSVASVGRSASFRAGDAPAGFNGGVATVGGGTAGTPGTQKNGKLVIPTGAPVADGSTSSLSVESTPGTQYIALGKGVSGYNYLQFGSGEPGSIADVDGHVMAAALTMGGYSSWTISGNGSGAVIATTALTIRGEKIIRLGPSGYQFGQILFARVQIATAATDNALTYVIPTDTGLKGWATILVSNDDSNVVSSFELSFAINNVATVCSQPGATTNIVPAVIGAGEAGLAVDVDFSGQTLRVRWTRPDASMRTIMVELHLSEVAIS